ncbi:MAG: single-stranded-DNA-specific exonuclease RecJ [bacterium]|nr:single-stranded-DNA-specific exonuclease RecJ [bacterium]
MKSHWQIAKKITQEFQNKFPEVNPIVLQLLYNRGLTEQEKIDEFLNPDYGQDIHDPFLFTDMKKAVVRILKAIKNKEKITVHGDYDADGVSATVVMITTLKKLGANVDVYIPHRVSEGYGLNMNTVDELEKNGTNLIVTVDCGISSYDEVDYAAEKNIEVIITDHHEQPPKIPKAYAVINPHVEKEKYPFHELAGVGVAFKLVQGLVMEDKGNKLKAGFEKWLLDIVALGTIADCVPLVGENRTLVKYGLVVLRKTKRVGLRTMIESSRFNLASLDTQSVSFGIAPRINAAGRIDHANTAYELIMTENEKSAIKISGDLEKTNQQRQKITEKITNSSIEQIGQVKDQKILFTSGEDWQVGVVGLVAGRLSDKFSRPVIVMGMKGDDIVGSGRSIPGFDITRALIESKEYLEKYGGHAAACGFSLKKNNYEKFLEKMSSIASEKISDKDLIKSHKIDTEVKIENINWELVDKLNNFEPFGEGNSQPKFVSYGLEVNDLQKVGNEGKHLRIVVEKNGCQKKIIAFGFGQTIGNELMIGDIIDIVYEISINEWNGNRELQLKLVDIHKK